MAAAALSDSSLCSSGSAPAIAGLLGMDGGTYRSVEFGGEYIDALQIHGSVDWAGGGHVSTLEDIKRFLRGVFNCRLFTDIDTLDRFLDGPEASAEYFYGMGVGRKQILGKHLWGHLGHWGSFMSYCPEQRLSLCGTLNYDQAAHNDFIAEVLKVVFPDSCRA